MREAQATYDEQEKRRYHSEILRWIFLTYFRVLKKAPPNSPLLQPTLRGLARSVHTTISLSLSFYLFQSETVKLFYAASWPHVGRHAHLISIDFIPDLLKCLAQLLSNEASLSMCSFLRIYFLSRSLRPLPVCVCDSVAVAAAAAGVGLRIDRV
jgi:hypothetical protein